MKRDIRLQRFYRHPPERVWRALTDSTQIRRWYMETNFRAEVGQSFEFRTDPAPGFDGVLRGTVLEVDPPRRLVYSFKGGWMQRETTVTWTLTSQDGGTLVQLDHTGFTGLTDIAASFILGSGWQTFLARLPVVLDTQES